MVPAIIVVCVILLILAALMLFVHVKTKPRDLHAPDAIPAEVMADLQQVLTDLNKLCTSDNNYTLNVEVTA